MKRFSTWLIHKLGGYTNTEYQDICDQKKEYVMKCEAIQNAHNHVFRWLETPIMRVDMEMDRYNAVMIASMKDIHIPAEYLKRKLCERLSEQLFKDGLVSYDIYDDHASEMKMFRGSVTLMLPVGFGKERT